MRSKLLSLVIGSVCLTASAHPIDFDKIQHWTGTGPNRAALVIQYNGDIYGSDAYVWGYRWEDGEKPSGETMMKAICANSSRLSMLTQHTGSMGSTLCGVGYSLNQDILKRVFFNFEKAKEFEFINFDYYNVNSFMGQTEAPGDNAPDIAQATIDQAIAGTHCIQHPFDYGTYGYPAYDYDCWDIDPDTEVMCGPTTYEPKWLSAWYEGYWSYWCANNPTQDWMYSGSGFSGRTLVDGAVDGWSFTQFESAMVGGMGEGVPPCESGAIYYMPARIVADDLDLTRCERTIGTGGSAMPLIINFGKDAGISNLVMLLRFDIDLPSAESVLQLLDSDPAFSFEDSRLSIDADGDGVFNKSGCDASASGNWTLTEFEDCVVLSCEEINTPDYLLYLPSAESGAAAVLPDKMAVALRDAAISVPVFVQREKEYNAINYNWYRRADSLPTHTNTSSDIITQISSAAANFGQLTLKGNKVGDVYLHVRVRTGLGASYSYSNICRFTLLPPEIPVESLEFESALIEAPLNSKIENVLRVYPENATYTAFTYKSSDKSVATATATAFKTTKTAGSATISVNYTWNPEVSAEFEIVSELRHPMTDFVLREMEVSDDNVIVLNPKQMFGAIFDPVPANADIPDVTVTFEDNGTDKSNFIFSGYKVNYWDENNNRTQFFEVSGHRVGEGKMIVTTTDGTNISKTYTIRVEEQDHTPLAGGYTEGTILLNEEWFGHTNGGLNYITPEGDVMYQVYERENPGMSFGCTSQYAAIWSDKLIAVSKQAVDAGDPLPGGGRVVVVDAKSLKRLGSIDNLVFGEEIKSADGRAVVGATPNKVYVGTSNGIYIIDINEVKITGKITAFDESGSAGADLYSGQIGDMVHAGKYVFGIKQAIGAFVIDTETDQVVKNYPMVSVQGITQTADGNVWIASTVDGCGRFTCIDPETLEENTDMSVTLPAYVPYPTCSWGAWRSTPFVGSHSRNTIWFSAGGGIAGGSAKDKFYGWDVGSDPKDLVPAFDMEAANLSGSNTRVKQKTYGTLRYDERTGELIVMTTEDSASGHYRYNWTHFVDPETGEIIRTIALRPYYWFQAFAIFPDKHDAVIGLDDISVKIADGNKVIDLSQLVSDKDNIDANILLSVHDAPMVMSEDDNTTAKHAEVRIDGKNLIVSPKTVGKHFFTLSAQSNGRTVSKTISVNVFDNPSGIDSMPVKAPSITCDGKRISVNGLNGHSIRIFDIAGQQVAALYVDSDDYVFDFGQHSGVYIVNSDTNLCTKVIIR